MREPGTGPFATQSEDDDCCSDCGRASTGREIEVPGGSLCRLCLDDYRALAAKIVVPPFVLEVCS